MQGQDQYSEKSEYDNGYEDSEEDYSSSLENDQNSDEIAQKQLDLKKPMLSQESINHYVVSAQKEVQEERKRLQILDQERKSFASRMIACDKGSFAFNNEAKQKINQNNSLSNFTTSQKKLFGKFVDGTSKKDRLQELLQRTEQYTRFILQQNLKHHQSELRKKKEAVANKHNKGQSSRRRMLKDEMNNDMDSSDEDENGCTLTRLTVQPSILQGCDNLRDYQLDGLNWMISLNETGINGILADEMGLGKTIQTIALLAFLKEFKQINGYHLIIMPKSVVGNWIVEFRKWCPDFRVVNLIARKESREEIIKTQLQPGKFDVCLTTFEGVRICISALMKFNWEYIIIDEAHKIKNEDSQTSKRVRQFRSKYRLLLTGTPLQNNLHELWSLLNYLLPEIFSSSDDFDEWFDLGSKADTSLSDEEKARKNDDIIKQLHKIIRPFMLRRIKREVEKSLLPKIEMHINVGITETQKSIYRQLLKKNTIEKGSSATHYKNILVQLRKVCDHPYLFPGVEAEDAPVLGDHLIKTCGKMQFLDKLLFKAKNDNSQTLIFSGFTTMLNILEDYCRFREYKYCRLDGNTELDDRQSQIDDFTSMGTDKFIFLISTRAGGLGLNLMTANTVILYDSDWNPQMDLQAMDRAHRIGQKKQVRVYRLITKNTMEEKMVEKQTMKLKLDSLIIQKGRMAPKNTGYQKDDLQDMVNYGADAIFEIGSNIDDDDIEQMIKDGEDKAANLQKQAEEIMKDKFNMINFELNSCNLYQFEDIDYLQEKRKEANDKIKNHVIQMLDQETAELTRRKVKKNLAESSLCPTIYSNGNVGVSMDAKKKRLAKITDFRFYPDPYRLKELIELEMDAKYAGYVKGADIKFFTPEMKIEKELIESKGFPEWDRREYQKFVQALELYATDDYYNISKHIGGTKTYIEVQKYAMIFFQKIDCLHDGAKIIARIQKAQKNVSFNLRAPTIIKNKVEMYKNPMDEMNIIHATQKSKFFSKESDIILMCLTHKIGYGNWQQIKKAVQREQRCRFDHLFVTRNEDELKKRVIYLVQSLEKEQTDGIKRKENTIPAENLQISSNLDSDERMENMMKEFEIEFEAELALKNLNLNSVGGQSFPAEYQDQNEIDIKYQQGKNSQSTFNQSSDQLELNQIQIQQKEILNQNQINQIKNDMIDDEEMGSVNEYDQPHYDNNDQAILNKEQKLKGNNRIKNLNRSFDSQNSDICIGNGKSHYHTKKDRVEEDADEEEAILKRELGCDMSDDMDSEYNNLHKDYQKHKILESQNEYKTTEEATDTHLRKDQNLKTQSSEAAKVQNGSNNFKKYGLNGSDSKFPNRFAQYPQKNGTLKPKTVKNTQKLAVNMQSSTKSMKQSNLANWVNNSSQTQQKLLDVKNSTQNLVGQKRLNCEVGQNNDPMITTDDTANKQQMELDSTANLKQADYTDGGIQNKNKRQNTNDLTSQHQNTHHISEFTL